jgi:hypothetical protein
VLAVTVGLEVAVAVMLVHQMELQQAQTPTWVVAAEEAPLAPLEKQAVQASS